MSTYSEHLEKLSTDLNAWSDSFPEGIRNVQSLAVEFSAKLERFRAEEQRLSIGVMGQVKAGKSTFLNALLFDGEPVLPEAATPKTANLTLVTYGESPRLELEYYTEDEWRSLAELAAGQGTHPEARMARELMGMVRVSGIDPYEKTAAGTEIKELENIGELSGMLNDYAGENGRYTPVIKMIRLFIPREELRNLEVVDTPGMNDPVISRTEKTKEYMARCDVVFFLSRCGQFLDSSDIILLGSQIPGKGVKRMILVACQYDSAFLDDGYDRSGIAETERNLLTRLGRRAEEEMEKLAANYESRDRHEAAALVRGLKVPVFASTFAYGFASWTPEKWSRSMEHIYKELSEMAEDSWDGYVFTREDWERIGNFGTLRQHYERAAADRKAILHKQVSSMEPESRAELRTRLDGLNDVVSQRLLFLDKNDITSIEQNRRDAEGRIAGIVSVLSEIIGTYVVNIRKTALEITAQLQKEMGHCSQMTARTGTETWTSYRTVSAAKIWNPFSWWSTKEVPVTNTRSYQYILAADAVEKVVVYGNESAAAIQSCFAGMLDQALLKADLRKALISELDTSSTGFDPNWFRSVTEQAIRQLVIPSLRMDLGDTAGMIADHFQGEIRNDRMEQITAALGRALSSVFKRIMDVFEPAVNEVCRQLEVSERGLGAELTAGLNSELEKIRAAFADKQSEMESYRRLVKRIEMEM